jgi:16S rRNA (guanine966-N2)-methyltransferase
MRIISGRFKGRKLHAFKADHVRPTTDRIKENIFNIAAGNIPDARVLDLYSGTGNLGLEALSRGAKSVDFVENHRASVQIILKNIELLGVEDEVEIHRMEALEFLTRRKGEPFDIILADPPFPSRICAETIKKCGESAAAGPETLVIIEHSKQEPLEPQIGAMECIDTRQYGDKFLSFYRRLPNQGMST